MLECKKTIFADLLELMRRNGTDFTPMVHSTLNEKFSVAEDMRTPSGKYPTTEYLAIGIGAHTARVGNNNRVAFDVLEHAVTDAALYSHIPHLIRPLGGDLTDAERANYAMRTLITDPQGNQWYAYYLRLLNKTPSVPEVVTFVGSDYDPEADTYEPSPSQLNPTALPISTVAANKASGKKISVSAKTRISFSEQDVEELINVINVLFDGDLGYGMISEMAIVAAHSETYISEIGGVATQYKEAVDATIQCHIPTSTAINYTRLGFHVDYTLGDVVPYIR